MKNRLIVLLLTASLFAAAGGPPKQAVVNVQKTSLTKDQELQLGKQAADQVEREMEVIHNPEIEAWLNQIGQSLAKTPQANAYPYYFKLVNEPSINAFALPGGPMYVHTGLLQAADTEGEVAGVLAHEMSHVALRHGAAQISKQQTWGTVFGVLGAAAGSVLSNGGGCGMLCQAAQSGVGLGANGLLMKFSRGYEHDADLNGARMMNSAGYDPIGLPTFFQKLEATMGTASEPKGLALFMASHPATGRRIDYVSEDIKFYQKPTYAADTGKFPRIKSLVANVPPPKPKPPALLSAIQSQPRQNIPQGFKDYAAKGFNVAYPSAWQAGQAQQGGSVYLIPQGGAAKSQNGVELLTGAMVDYYVPAAGAETTHLDRATAEFIDNLKKGDTNLRAERSSSIRLDGVPALMTKLSSKTSNGQDQQIYLYTVARQAGLWYMVQAGAPQQMGDLEGAFKQMTQSVAFPRDVP